MAVESCVRKKFKVTALTEAFFDKRGKKKEENGTQQFWTRQQHHQFRLFRSPIQAVPCSSSVSQQANSWLACGTGWNSSCAPGGRCRCTSRGVRMSDGAGRFYDLSEEKRQISYVPLGQHFVFLCRLRYSAKCPDECFTDTTPHLCPLSIHILEHCVQDVE